ncbi:hypothetical protein BCR43DRAFT_489932, partial [Syncephalastrum racemosum]
MRHTTPLPRGRCVKSMDPMRILNIEEKTYFFSKSVMCTEYRIDLLPVRERIPHESGNMLMGGDMARKFSPPLQLKLLYCTRHFLFFLVLCIHTFPLMQCQLPLPRRHLVLLLSL